MLSFRLKLAIRTLLRNKTYTLLNVMGLALGLGVSIIIYLYLQSELSYDRHYRNYREVYRINSEIRINDHAEKYAVSGYGLAPLLMKEYDFIESATRLKHINENVLFRANGRKINEGNIARADSNFFRVFDIPFVYGNRETALSRPKCIVLTRSLARLFFDEENPVGRVVSTNNNDYTVTGLIEDIPFNSHHRFSAIISTFHYTDNIKDLAQSLWTIEYHTFVRMDRANEPELLNETFPDFYYRYMDDEGDELEAHYEIDIARIDTIHFANAANYDRPEGDKKYLYAFGAIGLVILSLACINYINMATVRSLRKVKDTAMQKVLGAGKREVAGQILIESFLLSLAALIFAFVMVELTLELTPLNRVINKDLSLNFVEYPALWWLPLCLSVVVALLSGWYPSIYLSRVPALAAVKGGLLSSGKGLGLRKLLVGFQFVISVAVVITSLFMYRQMEFIRSKDLGFNKEDVVLIPIQDSATARQYPEIQKNMEMSPYIRASSTANAIPGKTVDRILVKMQNGNRKYEQKMVDFMMVGVNYFETMEIELIEGKAFSYDYFKKEEGYPVVINEALAESMRWSDPLGKQLKFVAPGHEEDITGTVIGVVRNFNAHSLHQPIEPAIITLQEENMGYIYVRIDSKNMQEALSDIEKTFAELRPDSPFQFSFLNQDLMRQYEDEQRQSKLILFLTYLAIFISFLGLTGLASFITGLRTREVGIRKILGADVRQMVGLIFRDMLLLIVVSVVVAVPLAYFLITQWLSNFAYKTYLDPWIFILSGAVAIALAYTVISYHSVRVARKRSVETLRYE